MHLLSLYKWLRIAVILLLYMTLYMTILTVAVQRCGGEVSIFGKMLSGHTFHEIKTHSGFECLRACDADVRCQSFNYVMSNGTCELNNRTKEARPRDFVPNVERYYMKRDRDKVILGSIPQLPAESCSEIKSSERGQAVSGKYWFSSVVPGKVLMAHCDMNTEDLDECTVGPRLCNVNATCSNTLGSYICTCQSAYYGNGTNCELRTRGLNNSFILGGFDPSKYLWKLLSFLDPVLNDSAQSNFVRCYHANTDGWAAATFHSNCDGKGPTLTIIQVNTSIFGAYTNVPWFQSPCTYSNASKAFIFSLYNTRGYYPVKLAQYRSEQFAMNGCPNFGPTFGASHDIHIYDYASTTNKSHSKLGSTYQPPSGCSYADECSTTFLAGDYYFIPTDYEVFYETTS